MNHHPFEGFDVISTYTRQQAIDDGVLIDVTETAREAGWRVPVALTAAVWSDCVAWSEEDTKRKRCPQDESGRLWDVLWMSFLAAKRHAMRCEKDPTLSPSICMMQVYRVPRDGRGHRSRLVQLKVMIGGGDQGEPVATILEPNED